MKLLLRAAALAFVVSCAGAAVAQPSAQAIRKAAEYFDQGRDAYKGERYGEAGEHFEAANSYAPSNKALEFAIRSRRNAGHLDRAATLAELALRRYPNDAGLKELADEVLAETATELHRVEVSCTAPCELVVGTTLVPGPAATKRVVYLDPGEHEVRASFDGGGTVSKTVVAESGGESALAFESPAGTEPEVTPEPDLDYDEDVDEGDVTKDDGSNEDAAGGGLPPGVFYGGLALTAVGIGVSVWSYVDLLENPGEDNVRISCRGLGEDCPEWQEAKDNELRTNIILGATAAVGVATILIGAAFTDWGGDDDESTGEKRAARRRSPSVYPWVSVAADDGAMVGAFGRF